MLELHLRGSEQKQLLVAVERQGARGAVAHGAVRITFLRPIDFWSFDII